MNFIKKSTKFGLKTTYTVGLLPFITVGVLFGFGGSLVKNK